MDIFCSTIIPTVNRPTLSRAVLSVLYQNFCDADFEIIVVNDSGSPLPNMDWQEDERVRVIDTNRHERSVARNTGAAIAKGKYLHFLDDDDILLPGAFEAFWATSQVSDANWLNGSYQTVDNDGNLIEEIHPETTGNNFAQLVAGEGIPLQASLLRTDQFFASGGFDPMITGVEDRDLCRRIAFSGTIIDISALVARIRIGEQGSTTDWVKISADDRWGREKALTLQNSYHRLRESADSCSWHGRVRRAYWHGRVCRAFFASMAWNLQRRNLLISISRTISALAFAGLHTIRSEFWHGLFNEEVLIITSQMAEENASVDYQNPKVDFGMSLEKKTE